MSNEGPCTINSYADLKACLAPFVGGTQLNFGGSLFPEAGGLVAYFN